MTAALHLSTIEHTFDYPVVGPSPAAELEGFPGPRLLPERRTPGPEGSAEIERSGGSFGPLDLTAERERERTSK